MKKNSILPLKQRKNMFYRYEAFLFLLSIALCLMPLASLIADKTKIVSILVGSMFWIGFIGTICMAISINKSRKKCIAFNRECVSSIKTIGLINFFKNKYAVITDIFMAVFLIGFIVSDIILTKNYIPFIFFAVLVYSFGMHCMLNGINYRYINYNVGRELES